MVKAYPIKSQERALDQVFHALSDSTRRSILRDVSKKEKTVTQIAKPYPMSLAAISKHLKVLQGARLIGRRKRGSYRIVGLRARTLLSAEQWIGYYRRFWDSRLESLKTLLESHRK